MKMTRFSRFLIALIIVLCILFAVRYAILNTEQGQEIREKAEKAAEEHDIEDPIFNQINLFTQNKLKE